MSTISASNGIVASEVPSAGFDRLQNHIGGMLVDKLPAFIYLLAKDYTLQYTNKYFQSQFGEIDTSSRCYTVMRACHTSCDSCPAHTVFSEMTELV